MKEESKTPKLRRKHKKLAMALVKHDMDKKKAYASTYPNAGRNTVASQAYQIHKKHPAIMEEAQNMLQTALNREQMTVNHLAKDLKEVIDNPTKEVATQQGIVTIRDQNIKLKAVSKAFDLHMGKDSRESSGNTTNVQININEATTDKLNTVLSSIKEMSAKLGITSEDMQDGEITPANTGERIVENALD